MSDLSAAKTFALGIQATNGVADSVYVNPQKPWANEMKSVKNWFKRLSEHRKTQRLKSPMLVAYYWDGSTPMPHKVQDISSTGFYLITEERWRPGTIVTMTLQRTSTERTIPGASVHIAVLSKVVRLGEDGVGLSFVPVETEEKVVHGGPVGKRTINSFLDQLKSDRGHAVIGHLEVALKAKLLGQDPRSAIPGERYEESEG